MFSELSSFQESTVGYIQPLASFRFVFCILVDWSFHLPIWATGFQERKMSAVITGHFKRSSSSWISYFSSWGTLPAQMWASFLFIVYSYLPPFSLMSPSSKTASLHNWLGQLAKKVTLLSSTGLFLNKIFRNLGFACRKLKFILLGVSSSSDSSSSYVRSWTDLTSHSAETDFTLITEVQSFQLFFSPNTTPSLSPRCWFETTSISQMAWVFSGDHYC